MNLLRTATTPPAPNRWKIVDRTDDECDELPEVAEFWEEEPQAYECFEKGIAEGKSLALYSCHDDGRDCTPWELEEYDGEDLHHPENQACEACGSTRYYLFPSGHCTACAPHPGQAA